MYINRQSRILTFNWLLVLWCTEGGDSMYPSTAMDSFAKTQQSAEVESIMIPTREIAERSWTVTWGKAAWVYGCSISDYRGLRGRRNRDLENRPCVRGNPPIILIKRTLSTLFPSLCKGVPHTVFGVHERRSYVILRGVYNTDGNLYFIILDVTTIVCCSV